MPHSRTLERPTLGGPSDLFAPNVTLILMSPIYSRNEPATSNLEKEEGGRMLSDLGQDALVPGVLFATKLGALRGQPATARAMRA